MRPRRNAEDLFFKFRMNDLICHGLLFFFCFFGHRRLRLLARLRRALDDHHAALRAGNRAFDEEQIILGPDLDDFQVLHRNALVAPMTGHALAFEDAPRVRAVADRAAVTEIFVRAVRARKTGEAPALDDAAEAVALADAGDVDEITRLEEIAGLDLLAELVLAGFVGAKLAQHFECALAGFFKMSLFGLIDALRLAAAEAHLQRVVAVARRLFLLHDDARSGL